MRLNDENASFRFNQSGLRKFLGDLECEIMELVWQKAHPTVTVRDIFEYINQTRPIAYTTVMTTMMRLAEKGLLRIADKSRLANCYVAEQSRQQFITQAVERVLGTFFQEFPKESLAYFNKVKRASK